MNKKDFLLDKKRRLLALAMAVTLTTTSLTACGSDTKLKYETQDNGIVIVTGEIKYDSLKKAKLVHIKNEIAEIDKYYLAIYETNVGRYNTKNIYIDIETGKIIYEEENEDFKNFSLEVVLDGLVDYLYKYDMVKEKYNIEDIEFIKESLLNDQTLLPTLKSNQKSLKRKPNIL